jgi:hypothetical protein
MSETYIPLTEIGKYLPWIRPEGPDRVTVWKWTRYGVGGVKLRTEKIGGRRFTTLEAITEFRAALNRDRCPAAQVATSIDAALANAELDAAGW